MRWNQYAEDPTRASALGDILLGAAVATGKLTEAKLAVVHGQVAKVLGRSELPDEVIAHLGRFEARRFDLGAAIKRLALDNARDRIGVMKAVGVVISADGAVAPEERAYALRVATQVGVAWNDIINLVGVPARPITAPRPRVTPRV